MRGSGAEIARGFGAKRPQKKDSIAIIGYRKYHVNEKGLLASRP